MIHATVVHASRAARREAAALPRQLVHLPARLPAADPEEYLLTGPLEPTNEPYAIAKIAGIKLCQAYRRQYGCDFISAMPTNLYGPDDNFDLDELARAAGADPQVPRRQAGAARTATVWGTRHAAARVPARRRPRRRVPVPDGALRRRRAHQRRHRRGPDHPRARRDGPRRRRARRRRSCSTRRSRTARRASCSTSAACTRSAGGTASGCDEGSRQPTSGSARKRSSAGVSRSQRCRRGSASRRPMRRPA